MSYAQGPPRRCRGVGAGGPQGHSGKRGLPSVPDSAASVSDLAASAHERTRNRELVESGLKLLHVAAVAGRAGKLVDKKHALESVLLIKERLYGLQDAQVGKTLHNLGNVHGKLGAYAA